MNELHHTTDIYLTAKVPTAHWLMAVTPTVSKGKNSSTISDKPKKSPIVAF